MANGHQKFLKSPTGKQWERIGIERRAGVAAPLFSIYSAASTGIGELPDLRLLVDWCVLTGMSIIQLLPLNDTGFRFTPYDAQTTFALDPMYLALDNLQGVPPALYRKEKAFLQKQFPTGGERLDYGIKKAKLDLFWNVFQQVSSSGGGAFDRYVQANHFWLEDFAVFKVIKENHQEAGWEDWPGDLKSRDPAAMGEIKKKYAQRIRFHEWLQWQLCEQFKQVKAYAVSKKVYLMGDLPFLVSKDSADVWAHQDYFKLQLSSGAPPDLYFAKGQRWGMPPYHWGPIAEHGYDYLAEKLKYAENFYDFFRIDHAVGTFRLWTISLNEPAEHAGLNGVFDPADEKLWEEHGRKILSTMVEHTTMLPCAEDLGVIPKCSFTVLAEMGIPGMDVQRWMRDWGKSYDFKSVDEYRINSIAVVSTHDMQALRGWWELEVGTVDEILFKRICEKEGVSFEQVKVGLFDSEHSFYGRLRWRQDVDNEEKLLSVLKMTEAKAYHFLDMYRSSYDEEVKFLNFLEIPQNQWARYTCDLNEKNVADFTARVIKKASSASSVFSVQLLQDWLSCDPDFQYDPIEFRINVPGTYSDKNWSLVMPWSLENMISLESNAKIKTINRETNRI
ncbi:MAG: 4-alpha-glucanotransferase [Candidatus Omnitrophica bacterium]|nr:4-alpha-glucanotransferase [Candidatus Omnitrophota bacterium]MDD5671496.1 4-alpha-glucanotransferase [Candidatus Omnitrophota bacterium]